MKVIIEGEVNEIAALVKKLQERQGKNVDCQVSSEPLTMEGKSKDGFFFI